MSVRAFHAPGRVLAILEGRAQNNPKEELSVLLKSPKLTKLGQLSNLGYDLKALIQSEKKYQILLQAYEISKSSFDDLWTLAIGSRLVELGAPLKLRIEHQNRLIFAGKFEEAAKLWDKFSERKVGVSRYNFWHSIILLHQKNIKDFKQPLARFMEVVDQDCEKEYWYLCNTLHHLGHFAEAKALAEKGICIFENKTELRAELVRIILTIDGPDAAKLRLDCFAKVIPTEHTAYTELLAEILIFKGRYHEAAEVLAEAIKLDWRRFELYSLLDNAATHADRASLYENAIEILEHHLPDNKIVLMSKLSQVTANDLEHDIIDLLKRIREDNELQYQVALLLLATKDGNPEVLQRQRIKAIDAGMDSVLANIIYANSQYYFVDRKADILGALELTKELLSRRAPFPAEIRLYYRLLLALGHEKECREHWSKLPGGLKSSEFLMPFGPYFKHLDGEENAAKKEWVNILHQTGNDAISSSSTPPQLVQLNYKANPEAILLFATVFNGIEYVEWFLNTYRELGVDHFFLIDNGSDDGTFEYFQEQSDVTLFLQPGSFSQSKCGIYWINFLMQKYGIGHWCLQVDMDERIIFAGVEDGRNLRDVTAFMDAEGAGCMSSFMLEIYPEKLAQTKENDLFSSSIYIDDDYAFLPNELPPYNYVKGGVRGRMAGQHLLMTKSPLIKMEPEFYYLVNNHHHTHSMPSSLTSALLHYKFIGEIKSRVEEAIEKGEHYLGARFYKAIDASLKNGKLKDKHSLIYKNSDQLVELNYLSNPKGWSA